MIFAFMAELAINGVCSHSSWLHVMGNLYSRMFVGVLI